MQFAGHAFKCLCSGQRGTHHSSFPKGDGTAKGFAAACPLAQFEWPQQDSSRDCPMHGDTGRGTRSKESHGGAKSSLNSDNGTQTSQGLQGCQTKIILMGIIYLYSYSKF